MNKKYLVAKSEEAVYTTQALRQTIVKARTNEELFNLVRRAIELNPVRVIITPRVDAGHKAYYWIGVRYENRELDFKLGVNSEIQSYLRAYLVGCSQMIFLRLATMKRTL